MTIKPGDRLPDATFKRFGASGLEDFKLGDHLKGKKVILFAVPGAFTPSCNEKHLPGYIANADKIKQEGVSEIICIAVNDPFVMKHWGQAAGADGKITMLPDWNGAFVDSLGLSFDASGAGLGKRAKRFSMIVEDGVVKDLQVEEVASAVELSSADACMVRLKK